MALFKILNNFDSGRAISSVSNYVQGYCYFDKNTGKFWIDTINDSTGRLAINGTFYGTCDSLIDDDVKLVTCSGFTLSEGSVIFIRFNTSNSI